MICILQCHAIQRILVIQMPYASLMSASYSTNACAAKVMKVMATSALNVKHLAYLYVYIILDYNLISNF